MKLEIMWKRQSILMAGFLCLLLSIAGNAQDVINQNGERESLMEKFNQTRFEEGYAADESRQRQQAKLTASEGTYDDNFGYDVAVAGDTAVIGAPRDDIGSNADQGSVYVFTRANRVWTFRQKLTASDGAAGDLFGHSVALADTGAGAPMLQTVIMVGAVADDIGSNANQGSVYVFTRSSISANFIAQGKLTASDGEAHDSFGASVAMNSTFTVVGANGDNGTFADQGAAYVFTRNNGVWQQEQKLISQFAAFKENMGWSVDISNTTIIVGTNQLEASGRGQAYIFLRQSVGNWVTQSSIGGGQSLGSSVAISGDTAVIGERLATVNSNTTRGRAFILERTGQNWAIQSALIASDGTAGDEFGKSLAMSGNTIVAGAHSDTPIGNAYQGSAYVFRRSGNSWMQSQRILDSTGTVGDYFGNSVAVSGDTIIVGAWLDDVGQFGQAGSASVFKNLNFFAPFDFDGDNKTDLSVFRPSSGEWFTNLSSTGSVIISPFGLGSDRLVPGDYTGDGRADIAVFRPSNGTYYVQNSETLGTYAFQFATSTDILAPADYDGDGKTDPAHFRPSTLNWTIQKSSGGTDLISFGLANDLPVVADYDGDEKADIAITRINNGNREWWIRKSSNGQVTAVTFGLTEDKTAPGDYTGDGKADIALFRPSTGTWYVLRSEDQSFFSVQFGATGDIPAPGDYDGDSKFDYAVFRPSDTGWYISKSSGGIMTAQFGLSGDIPVASVYVR